MNRYYAHRLVFLFSLLTLPVFVYAAEPQDIDAANKANNTPFTFEFRAGSPKKVAIHLINSGANTFWGFGAVNFPGCGPAAGETYTCQGITLRLPVGSRSNAVDPGLPATVEWSGTNPPPTPINFTLLVGNETVSRTYIIKFGPSSPPPPPPPPTPNIDPAQSTVTGGRIIGTIQNGRMDVLVQLVTPNGEAVKGVARGFKVVASTVRLGSVVDNQDGSYTLTLRGNFNASGRIQCFSVPLFAGQFKTLDPGPFPR
jgi:hypothetical protein